MTPAEVLLIHVKGVSKVHDGFQDPRHRPIRSAGSVVRCNRGAIKTVCPPPGATPTRRAAAAAVCSRRCGSGPPSNTAQPGRGLAKLDRDRKDNEK